MQMKTASNGKHEYLLMSHHVLGIAAKQTTGFLGRINSAAGGSGELPLCEWVSDGEGLSSAQSEANVYPSCSLFLQAAARAPPGVGPHAAPHPAPALSPPLASFFLPTSPRVCGEPEPPVTSGAESFKRCSLENKQEEDTELGALDTRAAPPVGGSMTN